MPITIKSKEGDVLIGKPATAPVQPISFSFVGKPPELKDEVGPPVSKDPLNEPVVKLANATKLYQRVHGSDSSSVYFCIGVSIDGKLKLAARRKGGGALSVRAEWSPTASGYPAKLYEAGFEAKGSGYCSIHVKANTEQEVARVIGALLFSVGVEWATPLPRLDHFLALCKKGAV